MVVNQEGKAVARISKASLTKLEIIQVALHNFLINGYSNTTISSISKELGISTGNLTFHFPTKEHLLAILVEMLCDYQAKLMAKEAGEGISSIMAICLEHATMSVMCHQNEILKDFFISSYTTPMTLDIIRRSDRERAKVVFKDYCKDWTEEQFSEAEVLVSGIEYASFLETSMPISIETRIAGALRQILSIYNVPNDVIETKIKRVLESNYKDIAKRVFKDFIKDVEKNTNQAFEELIHSKKRRISQGGTI